jgi:hypothetical protein
VCALPTRSMQAARAAWFDEHLHGRLPGSSPLAGEFPHMMALTLRGGASGYRRLGAGHDQGAQVTNPANSSSDTSTCCFLPTLLVHTGHSPIPGSSPLAPSSPRWPGTSPVQGENFLNPADTVLIAAAVLHRCRCRAWCVCCTSGEHSWQLTCQLCLHTPVRGPARNFCWCHHAAYLPSAFGQSPTGPDLPESIVA